MDRVGSFGDFSDWSAPPGFLTGPNRPASGAALVEDEIASTAPTGRGFLLPSQLYRKSPPVREVVNGAVAAGAAELALFRFSVNKAGCVVKSAGMVADEVAFPAWQHALRQMGNALLSGGYRAFQRGATMGAQSVLSDNKAWKGFLGSLGVTGPYAAATTGAAASTLVLPVITVPDVVKQSMDLRNAQGVSANLGSVFRGVVARPGMIAETGLQIVWRNNSTFFAAYFAKSWANQRSKQDFPDSSAFVQKMVGAVYSMPMLVPVFAALFPLDGAKVLQNEELTRAMDRLAQQKALLANAGERGLSEVEVTLIKREISGIEKELKFNATRTLLRVRDAYGREFDSLGNFAKECVRDGMTAREFFARVKGTACFWRVAQMSMSLPLCITLFELISGYMDTKN